MNCRIQLNRADFVQRDEFTAQITSVNTSHVQLNQTDANHQDAVRIQPKRGAKSANASIPKMSASTGEKTTSKQQSTALRKTTQLNNNVLIKVGQLVLAKQSYSVPWPSKILSIKQNSVCVYFFGDGRCGSVKKCNLFSMSDSEAIVLNCLNRNITGYRKGIIEMERTSGVPDNWSIAYMN